MTLVNRGLATNKNDGKYTTFKYARKAMYNYLWFQEPDLQECRGHVYDNETKELVQAAPRKSFNYGEQGFWTEKPLDTVVEYYKKINGYMLCVTKHKGELVVSTTGTTTSEYAQWGRELILKDYDLYDLVIEEDVTTLFEVVVPQDPHIVQEREGLHLLGVREKANGNFHPMGTKYTGNLGSVLAAAKLDRGEGFMVYEKGNYTQCCKVKSDYYVGKKKLMRMSKANVELMYKYPNSVTVPEMWRSTAVDITKTFPKDFWLENDAQKRRIVLESYLG